LSGLSRFGHCPPPPFAVAISTSELHNLVADLHTTLSCIFYMSLSIHLGGQINQRQPLFGRKVEAEAAFGNE